MQLAPLFHSRTYLSPPKETLYPWAVTPHSSSPSPGQPAMCFLFLWICLLWTFYINGIMQHVTFCVWLLLLNTVFSRFVVANASTSFLSQAEEYLCHFLFIHSSVNRQLGCFPFLALQPVLLWTFMYTLLWGTLLSILLGTYLGVDSWVIW